MVTANNDPAQIASPVNRRQSLRQSGGGPGGSAVARAPGQGGRGPFGPGVRPNDIAHMRAWLADPPRYKPGSLMPRGPLSDADLDALATYLEGLK